MGRQWKEQESGIASKWINGIHFIDPKNGWASGGMGTILHTVDGGITWNEQKSNTIERFSKVFFVDANNGWVTGYSGTILHTTDGGNLWKPQNK